MHARRVIEVVNSGYSEGGASSRKLSMRSWSASGGSAREDIELNLDLLRRRSRSLYATSPIARAAIGRMQTNIIGSGLRLKSMPDYEALGLNAEEADAWSKQTERLFASWAQSKDCDIAGLNNFYEIQQIALISWLISGDVFILLPLNPLPWQMIDLRLQLIEADCVCDPEDYKGKNTVRSGVEIDENGRVVAYHIRNVHPYSSNDYSKQVTWRRVPVRGQRTGRYNILHLMNAERPDQYRGLPILAPIIESLHQISDYTRNELTASVVSSLFTVFITTPMPEFPLGEGIPNEEEVNEEMDYSRFVGNGSVVALKPGESIQTAQMNRPNVQFDNFVSSVAKMVGASLNIPSELLLLQFSSSYSASRAALLEAWKSFRAWRSWLSYDMCTPIYREWLTEAVLKGIVDAPGFLENPYLTDAWARCEWHGPTPGQVDPVKEVTAAIMRVENGFSTRAREAAELNGSDFNANVDQLAKENSLLMESKGETYGLLED